MATDLQPVFSTVSNAPKHTSSEMRERHESLSSSSFAHRFDSVLGRAESRPGSGQPSILSRTKQAARPHTSAHSSTSSSTHSQADKLSATAADARQETVSHKSESDQTQKEGADNGQAEQTSKVHKKSTQTTALSPEEFLAAGMATQVPQDEPLSALATAPSDESGTSRDGTAKSVDATVGEVSPVPAAGVSTLTTQPNSVTQSAPAPTSDQRPGQLPADVTASGDVNRPAGPPKSSDASPSETGKGDSGQVFQAQNQSVLSEAQVALTENSIREARAEPDKPGLATTVGGLQLTQKPVSGPNGPVPGELQSQFDSVMRVNDIAMGPNASSAEHFAGNDFSSSTGSHSEPEHSKSNLLPPEDGSLRPQFLDQTTGVSPSAPPSGDSRVGRSEAGQVPLMHASETERINELRETFSSAQTVTLDLDPLDMGPLRVRIMMTDQIVHAHIRTEHGELGQGLLQQGQSLEASLRTTGLEMGMLRVTVDQQQQGRGDNAWAFQQQPGRPGPASGLPSAPGEDERVSRGEYGFYNNGRVSFFA